MKKSLYVRLFGRFVIVLFLITVTFIYAMFQGGFVSWFIFYCFLPFGLYSLVIGLYPLNQFTVERIVNQKQFLAGESLQATIMITRRIRLIPLLYVVVEEELPSSLKFCQQSKRSKDIIFPWFSHTIKMEYRIDSIPRGEHIFSAVRIKTGDIFGLVEKEYIYEIEKAFLVYPQYVEIRYRQLENQFDQGYTSSRTKLIRDTTMAVGVREYQPGDRFSWIDWKASARRNTFMTKEFEQQQSHDVLLFMDRSRDQNKNLFEQVVILTASIVRSILKNGAQLGFVSIGENRYIAEVKKTHLHQQQIFHHLSKVQPDSKQFGEIVESEISKWQQGLTMLFITSELSESFVRTLEQMVHRQFNLIVFVILPKENPSKGTILKIESLKRKYITVKAITEGKYTDAFHEVSR